MSHNRIFRTAELAQAAGISAQQVRNYEAWGIVPPASRSAAGYRQYTARHLHALQTARTLMAGYGWEQARQAMAALHCGDQADALVVVDACHAALDQQRRQIERILGALRDVAAKRAEQALPDIGASDVSIGAAARSLGVRPSALRYWEEQGLVVPRRERASGYRRYSPDQMRQLEVLVLMRHSGYSAEVIAAVLGELAAGRAERAISAAEQRLRDLGDASRRCAHATAALWGYMTGEG
jgi:DNA-binding transcriptional MerR regulator